MRVLLISANTETTNMVPLPLGLNCVAVAAREAGHEVRLLDLMGSAENRQVIREAVQGLRPDVIGISARNIDDQFMAEPRFLLQPIRDTVSLCRAFSGATVVVGGAGFSIFPEAALRYLKADLGICGEGEVAFTALLRALERGDDLSGIPGLCRPGAGVQKGCAVRAGLETLPLPDPSLWTVSPRRRGDLDTVSDQARLSHEMQLLHHAGPRRHQDQKTSDRCGGKGDCPARGSRLRPFLLCRQHL